jgi:hypothetical protein
MDASFVPPEIRRAMEQDFELLLECMQCPLRHASVWPVGDWVPAGTDDDGEPYEELALVCGYGHQTRVGRSIIIGGGGR